MTRLGLAAGAAQVGAPLREVVRQLRALADEAVGVLATEGAGMQDVAVLQPTVRALLARNEALVGTGLVLAPGVLHDAELHLEWWRRAPDGTEHRLLLDLDPGSENFYDYPAREWFRAPAQGADLGISGPYVDYRGADDYVFTIAVPVVAGGRFVAVAGADYPLQTLEDRLEPVLRAMGPGVVLVNREQRVISGGSARWRPGERLRPPDVSAQDLVAAERVLVPPERAGWSLLELP